MLDTPTQPDYRLRLNNYLAQHGGSDRLTWDVRCDGPIHNTIWSAVANSEYLSCNAFCLIWAATYWDTVLFCLQSTV
jgi:hypothetical protein